MAGTEPTTTVSQNSDPLKDAQIKFLNDSLTQLNTATLCREPVFYQQKHDSYKGSTVETGVSWSEDFQKFSVDNNISVGYLVKQSRDYSEASYNDGYYRFEGSQDYLKGFSLHTEPGTILVQGKDTFIDSSSKGEKPPISANHKRSDMLLPFWRQDLFQFTPTNLVFIPSEEQKKKGLQGFPIDNPELAQAMYQAIVTKMRDIDSHFQTVHDREEQAKQTTDEQQAKIAAEAKQRHDAAQAKLLAALTPTKSQS